METRHISNPKYATCNLDVTKRIFIALKQTKIFIVQDYMRGSIVHASILLYRNRHLLENNFPNLLCQSTPDNVVIVNLTKLLLATDGKFKLPVTISDALHLNKFLGHILKDDHYVTIIHVSDNKTQYVDVPAESIAIEHVCLHSNAFQMIQPRTANGYNCTQGYNFIFHNSTRTKKKKITS